MFGKAFLVAMLATFFTVAYSLRITKIIFFSARRIAKAFPFFVLELYVLSYSIVCSDSTHTVTDPAFLLKKLYIIVYISSGVNIKDVQTSVKASTSNL
jgi:hypothetical protein